MRKKLIHIRIDDFVINGADPMRVIDPVWWTATIYDGPAAYDESLRNFSKSQRLVFAILWYLAEVRNGGHHQFYSNSTGIVWRDALEGFEAIDMPEIASIILKSTLLLGASPSPIREERWRQLEDSNADFEELDDEFYGFEKLGIFEGKIMDYVRAHATDFYFDGTISKP